MEDPLNIFEIGIGLLGGLALFLYGMHEMSEALKAAAGEGLKNLLAKLTTNRFSAALTGAVVTAIIQSSSVTTVLVVGFVSAGLMTLTQSVGVIMGANVGTTVTAQIVAFKVTQYAWAMVAAGFVVASFTRKDAAKHYGTMLLGLGLLFLGMDQMSDATNPLRSYPPFIDLMQRMDSPLWGILLGAGFTALVQSSSATTGIVIMLASQGFLSLEGGIALAIGANIGTCFTASLSAIGKPVEAVRAATVHVLFNVLGALLWVFFIPELADLARSISPASADLDGVARLAADTPRQIANANTIFNVVSTLVLLGFAGPIARLAVRLVPDRPSLEPETLQPRYLDEVYLQTPSVGLDRVRLELGHMGEQVVEMIGATRDAFRAGSRAELDAAAAGDEGVDELHRAVLRYLRELGREELTRTENETLRRMIAISNYLESTGDLVAKEIVGQARNLVASEDSQSTGLVDDILKVVESSLEEVLQALVEEDAEMARRVAARKREIHERVDRDLERLVELLNTGALELDAFRVAVDVLGQAKRLYYNVRKIADVLSPRSAARSVASR